MTKQDDVKTAEETFFSALVTGDVKALSALLTADFLIIDVMSGRQVGKTEFISAVETGLLKFKTIDPLSPTRTRLYGGTAIVTGETNLWVEFAGKDLKVRNRYTHVYVSQEGGWELASAQGTPIS